MSFESTAIYYRMINEEVRARLGGLTSADMLVHSVNFAEIVALQKAGDWAEAAERLAKSAASLEKAGAIASSSPRTRCTRSPMKSPVTSTFR